MTIAGVLGIVCGVLYLVVVVLFILMLRSGKSVDDMIREMFRRRPHG